LVVGSKDVEFALFFVPGIAISIFECKLLVIMVAVFDQSDEFFYLTLCNIGYADNGGVKLETNYEIS
jgi:hypothetical protein